VRDSVCDTCCVLRTVPAGCSALCGECCQIADATWKCEAAADLFIESRSKKMCGGWHAYEGARKCLGADSECAECCGELCLQPLTDTHTYTHTQHKLTDANAQSLSHSLSLHHSLSHTHKHRNSHKQMKSIRIRVRQKTNIYTHTHTHMCVHEYRCI